MKAGDSEIVSWWLAGVCPSGSVIHSANVSVSPYDVPAGATGWVVVPLAGIGSAIQADLRTHTPLSPDKTESPVPRHRSS